MHATLTINKANFEGIVFEDAEVTYDGQPHSIAPTVPTAYAGAEVSYDANGNSFTAAGLHKVTATVSLANYNDWSGSANLVISADAVATSTLKVIDFEDMSDNDLADEIDLKFYNNGWVTPAAANVKIEKNQVFGAGTNTMKMTMTHQGSAFKATKDLTNKTYEKYTGFRIDSMMDSRANGGTMKLAVQFWFKDLPLPDTYMGIDISGYRNTYATYTLADNAPSIWTHWEIPFTDEHLSIAGGAVSAEMLTALGYTMEDFSGYIDKVAVIITPNYVNGANCYAYIDNIELTRDTEKVEEKFIYGGTYGKENDSHLLALNMNATLTEGSFTVDGVEQSALEIEKGPDTVTFKDADNHGAGLTVNAAITDTGTLRVYQVTGAAQATFGYLNDMEFTKIANINYDLQGEAKTKHALADTNWKQEKYQDGWQNVSNQMNVRFNESDPSDENIFCNMTTGYYMDYRYTYTNPLQFGLANKFSVDIANDFSGSALIKVKVRLVQANGTETFVVGDANNYAEVPAATPKWYHIEADDFGEINVKAIVVTVKSTTSASQYLYFDNLKLSYEVEGALPPEPLKTIEDGEYYIWNSASDAFRLTVADSQTTGTFTKCGTENVYDITVDVDDEEVTMKDAASNGAGITVVANITADNQMQVTSVSGTVGSAISASLLNKTVKHSASANLNFSDGTVDSYYQESHWKESDYGNSGWTDYAAPTNMRSKQDKNSNKVVNMHCGTGAKNFRYTPDLPFGPVNHVEVDLGNYWGDSAGELRYKISLLDSDGSTVKKYVAGDGSTWATLAKDTSSGNICTKVEFDFDLVVGYALRITTSMASGQAYLYMDNLKVTYKAPEPLPPEPLTIEAGYYYIWNAADDAFRLSIPQGMTTATVTKCGGDSYAMNLAINDTTVTLSDQEYSGAGLTIELNIIENNKMQVTSVTGAAASLMSASLLNKQVKHCANVNLDFADGAGSGSYSDPCWSEKKYTTDWVDVATPEMNSRTDASSNKIVNFVCDAYTKNFIYTPELPMGPVNHISLTLGNYFGSSAGDIQYKICVIDGGGNKTYIAGDASNFATIAKDTSAGSVLGVSINEDFNLIAGAKVQITTKCSAGTSYLYMDNLLVSYIN